MNQNAGVVYNGEISYVVVDSFTSDSTEAVETGGTQPQEDGGEEGEEAEERRSSPEIHPEYNGLAPIQHQADQEMREDAMEDASGPALESHESIIVENKSPEDEKQVRLNESLSSDDDGQICSICFEPWSNTSEHRLAALRCGHLFGLSCIDKWLRGQGSKCPQCNLSAKKSDIRLIFAKCLKAIDTSERDRALQQLEKEQELRRRAELEAAQTRLSLQLSRKECERLTTELIEARRYVSVLMDRHKFQKSDSANTLSQAKLRLDFEEVQSLEISKNSGCRVLACSEILGMLVTSQLSTNNLFPGYGVKKVNLIDFRPSEFVKIHNKLIKDIAFHPHDSLLLTSSLDRTIKITNVLSNTVVQCYDVGGDAWSCMWNTNNPCYFYAGLANGSVLQFDIRLPGKHMSELPASGKTFPVVAMQYVNGSRDMAGPLVCRLSTCHFYQESSTNTECISHPLPLEGKFTSLHYEPTTNHFLVSCRPSQKNPKVSHTLCELSGSEESAGQCSVVQVCEGGSRQVQMSRSKVFLNPANRSSLLVCAGDEGNQAALIWDASKGSRVSTLVSEHPILDILPFQDQQGTFLSTLSSNTLKFYKWKDSL